MRLLTIVFLLFLTNFIITRNTQNHNVVKEINAKSDGISNNKISKKKEVIRAKEDTNMLNTNKRIKNFQYYEDHKPLRPTHPPAYYQNKYKEYISNQLKEKKFRIQHRYKCSDRFCKYCNIKDLSMCLGCHQGFFLVNNQCYKQCPLGKVADNYYFTCIDKPELKGLLFNLKL